METPCVIVKNWCDVYTLRVTDDGATIAAAQMLDYLHYTAYRQSTPTVIVFTITPPSADNVTTDCVVIDSETLDSACRVQVSVDAGSVVDVYGLAKGANLFNWTQDPQTTSVVVTLTPTRPLGIRSFWVARKWPLEDPRASEFDPEAIRSEQDVVTGESGTTNAVYLYGNKKILRASWSAVRSSTFLAMEQLRDFTHQLRLPFWFFFRPTSAPTRGYMYRLNQAEFLTPQGAGTLYSFSLEATAYFDYEEPGEVDTPGDKPQGLVFSDEDNPGGSVRLDWDHGSDYAGFYIVIRRAEEYPTSDPIDNAVYVEGDVITTGNVVAYVGDAPGFTDAPGSGNWYYHVIPFNRSADRTAYLAEDPLKDFVVLNG